MKPDTARLLVTFALLLLSFLLSRPLCAQTTGAALAGTVTAPSGAAVANAKVVVKNLANGQMKEVQTNSAGSYNVPDLMPGDYEVSVTAEGFSNKTAGVSSRQPPNRRCISHYRPDPVTPLHRHLVTSASVGSR